MKLSEVQAGKIYRSVINSSGYSPPTTWEILVKGDHWYVYQQNNINEPQFVNNRTADYELPWEEVKPKRKCYCSIWKNPADCIWAIGYTEKEVHDRAIQGYRNYSYLCLKEWVEEFEE